MSATPTDSLDFTALGNESRAKYDEETESNRKEAAGHVGRRLQDLTGPDSPLTKPRQTDFLRILGSHLDGVFAGEVQPDMSRALSSDSPSSSSTDTASTRTSEPAPEPPSPATPAPEPTPQNSAERARMQAQEEFVMNLSKDLGVPILMKGGGADLDQLREQIVKDINRRVQEAKDAATKAANEANQAELRQASDTAAAATRDLESYKQKAREHVGKAKAAFATVKPAGVKEKLRAFTQPLEIPIVTIEKEKLDVLGNELDELEQLTAPSGSTNS